MTVKPGRILRLVRDAWLMLGITLIVVLVGETGLTLAFAVKDYFTGSPHLTIDPRVKADTYSDTSWVHSYYREHRTVDVRWAPYLYWRRAHFHGKYININSDGNRWTPDDGKLVTIFMFGGSAMWGTGVRDGFTIPSLLASELHKTGVACEVVNFGETGYVSTQEVIALLLQLQKGKIPDLVILYDGVNDTFSAYQHQVAGLPLNELNRVSEFNLSRPERVGQLREMVLRDVTRGLSTTRLLHALSGQFGIRHESEQAANALSTHNAAPDSKSLSREVVGTYLTNVQLVMALGERYGFKHLFYWQPTIFQKAHLTEYERSERQKGEGQAQFFRQTYDAIRGSELTRKSAYSFRDLSMVFADVRKPLYIDWMHLGEAGNAMIAERMAKDVHSIVGAGKGTTRRGTASDGDPAGLHRRR